MRWKYYIETIGCGREEIGEFNTLKEAFDAARDSVQENFNCSDEGEHTKPSEMKTVPQCEDRLPSRWDTDQDVFY